MSTIKRWGWKVLADAGRGRDDVLPDIEGVAGVDLDGEGAVFFVGSLDHARNAHEVDLLRKGEPPGDGRTGQDENIDAVAAKLRGNGHGSPDVPQTIGVVGVHQNVEGAVLRHAADRRDPWDLKCCKQFRRLHPWSGASPIGSLLPELPAYSKDEIAPGRFCKTP